MKFGLAAALLLALIAALFSTLHIRSDADGLLAGRDASQALNSQSGRSLVIAAEHADLAIRNRVIRELSEWLSTDPLIATVRIGPSPPSEAARSWLWQQRLRLGIPDLDPASMTLRLQEAQRMFGRAEGMVLGDLYLRDPTGAFASLLTRFEDQAPQFPIHDGIWQAKDGDAALLLANFADRPFDADEVAGLIERIEAMAGHTVLHIVGPRVISAQIHAETKAGSMQAGLVAGILLIAWLGFVLRGLQGFVRTLMPLALAFATGLLAVQLIFGSVHAIALGFGGTLLGLALDYPLHLLGSPTERRQRAARLVWIGALTTAIGFLAMLGSGLSALMQTGVFIAAGLVTAAFWAQILASDSPAPIRTWRLPRWTWPGAHRSWIEGTLAFAGLAVIWIAGAPKPAALFEPPDEVLASIERLQSMLDLPSARYVIQTDAPDLSGLLAEQAALIPDLQAAMENGALGGYSMLASVLGDGDLPDLPGPEEFERLAAIALEEAGLAADFATTQREAYRMALRAPPLTLESLQALPEGRALLNGLSEADEGLRADVQLFEPVDAERLKSVLPLIDTSAAIAGALGSLRDQTVIWLGVGAIAAFICLYLSLRDRAATLGIALTTAATLGLTGAVLSLLSGPPGIFQIIALTLLVGISIDYGLFLRSSNDDVEDTEDGGSVALCAGSTLIAFLVMSFSSIKLLHEIGLTVVAGVLIAVTLHLAKSR